MTLPYVLRLICLCAAAFFLVHAALGLLLRLAARPIIQFAHRMKPREATHFLLLVRFLPVAASSFVVLSICLPSYLWFESGATKENVGAGFVIAALLGALIWIASLLRVGRAVAAAGQLVRKWKESCTESKFPGVSPPVEILESDAPVLLLAGVLRPRLVLSSGVLRSLSPQQLHSALRHEEAHRASRDNFKRLLLLLSPEIFPFARSFDLMDEAWALFSEWAADDDASGSNPEQSLTLAESLVRVARMGAAPRPAPLCTSFIPPDQDLAARVNRLLLPSSFQSELWRRLRAIFAGTACTLLVLLTFVLSRPSALQSVHQLLERLSH